MIKSVKGFVMGIIDIIHQFREFQSEQFTRDYRLNQYIESKGCKDAGCVEHWIREYERNEARRA